MEATVIHNDSSTRRRKVTKFALAGVAVLGVGAALTSAAWSDNVWFGGDASSANFDLDGSIDRSTWIEDSSSGAQIPLPADAFDAIGPLVGDTYDVWVRNDGDIPVYLSPAVVDVSDELDGFVTTEAVYNRTTLQPGQDARVRVTVTGTEDIAENLTGLITINVEGTSSAP